MYKLSKPLYFECNFVKHISYFISLTQALNKIDKNSLKRSEVSDNH